MTAKVPTSEIGTTTAGISVMRTERRNSSVTSTTRPTASTSSFCTSRTEARMLSVRSVRMRTSTLAGSVAVSCGSSARMRSATSMTLASGWRWTLMRIARSASAQAARKRSSGPSMIRATSLSRSGAPFFQATISDSYWSTVVIWSLASRMVLRTGPSKLPLGRLALAEAIAVCRSASVRPAPASAAASACTRIAGRCPPARLTSPTPCTCASFWAMRVSTRSCTRGSGRVSELTASVRIGVSAGLTLR